jgi:hypothetical protein
MIHIENDTLDNLVIVRLDSNHVRSLYIIRQDRKAGRFYRLSDQTIRCYFENGGLSSIARILGRIMIVPLIQ